MKLHCHYCRSAFSNCYILGTDLPDPAANLPLPPGEAIIIDPGEMDVNILKFIEDNNYTLRGVLITHDHSFHVNGLATIMRIYNTEIFAINPIIMNHRTTLLRDEDVVTVGPFRVEVLSVPGHSADSAVFKIDRLLFTGDTLTAGLIGNTISSFAAATQASALRSKILSLPGDYTILPGQGPPTSLKAECRFNMGIASFEAQKNRRPVFRLDL
ncbi:MAG: MBL fold metallo-hydrolase [Treponema sp.]|nr:MBL fold metallo-hydrolase [Treponema sp.]